MQFYYATVIAGYAIKQVLPAELAAELTRIHSCPDIDIFRYPEGGLWVSLQHSGIRTMDLREVNQILIKKRDTDTFWGMDITSAREYEPRLRSITAEAGTLFARLNEYPMMTDYGSFQKAVLGDFNEATENDGPMTQWIEIHSLEQDQADHTIRHRTAKDFMDERREQAIKRFLSGDQLTAPMFESLLRQIGLWSAIPARTKAFIGRQLSTITKEGLYSYEPDDCHRGNPLVGSLAPRLAVALATGAHREPKRQPVDWYAYQIVKVSAYIRDYDGDDVPVWQWYDSTVIGEGKMRVVNERNIAAALRRHGIVRPKGHTIITSAYGYDDCLYEVCAKRRNKPLYAVYVDDETILDKETRLAAKADSPPVQEPAVVNF